MFRTDNDLAFFERTLAKCRKNDISVILHPGKEYLAPGETIGSAGAFCDYERVLICCTGLPYEDWFGIFVHESCHMDQYLNNAKVWSLTDSLYDQFYRWREGELYLSQKKIDQAMEACIKVELDCERRAVRKIREYGLSLDLDLYVRKANSYLLSMAIVRKYERRFKKGKAPYLVKQLYSKLRPKLDYDYLSPPTNYENYVVKYCLK